MNKPLIERRKSPDKWIYLSRILTITSWLFFIVALVISFYAAPEQQYGYLIHRGIETRNTWLMPLTNYLYVILWVSAFTSFACLFIDKYRTRRVGDSKSFNLILLLIVLVAWVLYILMSVQQNA
jgi:hypothetical protein